MDAQLNSHGIGETKIANEKEEMAEPATLGTQALKILGPRSWAAEQPAVYTGL